MAVFDSVSGFNLSDEVNSDVQNRVYLTRNSATSYSQNCRWKLFEGWSDEKENRLKWEMSRMYWSSEKCYTRHHLEWQLLK